MPRRITPEKIFRSAGLPTVMHKNHPLVLRSNIAGSWARGGGRNNFLIGAKLRHMASSAYVRQVCRTAKSISNCSTHVLILVDFTAYTSPIVQLLYVSSR